MQDQWCPSIPALLVPYSPPHTRKLFPAQLKLLMSGVLQVGRLKNRTTSLPCEHVAVNLESRWLLEMLKGDMKLCERAYLTATKKESTTPQITSWDTLSYTGVCPLLLSFNICNCSRTGPPTRVNDPEVAEQPFQTYVQQRLIFLFHVMLNPVQMLTLKTGS